MTQALRILRDRSDVLALAAIFLSTIFFKGEIPLGIYGLGVVAGSALALHAIGIILIYRANRIINFSQMAIGVFAAYGWLVFSQYAPHIFRAFEAICPPCVEELGLSNTAYRVNYWVTLALFFMLSVFMGWLVYMLIIRRFSNAPRLIGTVATLFLSQVLAGMTTLWNQTLDEETRDRGVQLAANPPPNTDWMSFTFFKARFHAPDVITIVAALVAVGLLIVYLRRSPTGIAIRATADNPDRVATLGVNVRKVNGRVWLIAGALSGVAAMTQAMAVGVGGGGAVFGAGLLVRILAVAVIARMVSLPIAILAAVVLGMLEQGVLWAYGSTIVLDGALLFIIGIVLVLQRYRASRAELEQASGWRAARETRPTPRELRDLPTVRKFYRTSAVIGGVVILALPWVMTPSQTALGAAIMIYAMVFVSILVLTGWAGQVSLGQFAFSAVGAWVTAGFGIPFPLSIIVGALAGAVVALLVGLPALKLRGLHLAITTLAFALSTTAILLNPRYLGKRLPTTLRRPKIFGVDLDQQRTWYYLVLVVLVLICFAIVGIRRSRTARALIAARDNEAAAQSFGINLIRLRLAAFAMAGFIAALAGGLFAYHLHSVQGTAYQADLSLTFFLYTIIGGLGSVTAPLIGAAIYGVFQIFNATALVQQLGAGMGGLLILLLAPGGVGEVWFKLRDAALRWVARRNRLVVPSLLEDVRVDQKGKAKVPIAPKLRRGGGAAFIPERYRLDVDQWAFGIETAEEGPDIQTLEMKEDVAIADESPEPAPARS